MLATFMVLHIDSWTVHTRLVKIIIPTFKKKMADLPPKDSEDSPFRVSREEEESMIPKKRLPTKVLYQAHYIFINNY